MVPELVNTAASPNSSTSIPVADAESPRAVAMIVPLFSKLPPARTEVLGKTATGRYSLAGRVSYMTSFMCSRVMAGT